MMRPLVSAAIAGLLTAGLATAPAHAAGCLKGAAIGGVAGHYMGHHGLIGAGAGCLIGRHEAAKHARDNARSPQMQQGSTGGDPQAPSNYGR
jgi:hypothetical protein